MKNILSILLLSTLLFACTSSTNKETHEPDSVNNEKLAADYKTVEVVIEGMTCEIGCAKTIESKLSKMEGITYAKVSFEENKGEFTFNANVISKDDIKAKIEGIAGGDLYFVKKMTDLPKKLQNSN